MGMLLLDVRVPEAEEQGQSKLEEDVVRDQGQGVLRVQGS